VVSLRIATRGSELALWQAHAVRRALAGAGCAAEVRVVRTTGDRIQDVPLSRIGDKGLFTRELDAALLAGEADLAVHSLKDVPTRLPDGLVIAAVTERADPRDVLLLADGAAGALEGLPAGARVGTSSLRRRAQLAVRRPDLHVDDLRGNLNTRLAKLDAGGYDAIVLAAAGVERLGWEARIAERLDAPAWLPAAGQGALAVVVREDRVDVAERLRPLHHAATAAATAAERALLRALEGGCQVPIGALGTVEGERLVLHGLVASLDGGRVVRVEERGPAAEAEALGRRAAAELAARGADRILDEVRAALLPAPAAP
jgi:hydroxymethylbilane synthase